MRDNSDEKEKRREISRVMLTVGMILFFVCVIFVYYSMLYSETRRNIIDKGRINAVESASQIDMNMSSSIDALKLAVYNVDTMIKEDRSQEEILDYLTEETKSIENSIVADTTGIYGYIRGEYMDGSGWVPDANYNPTLRPWYVGARVGNGRMVIIDPYIDLYTGTTMISLVQSVGDGKSVVGVDVSMADIQETIEQHVLDGRSYEEFIINRSNLIVAHSDRDFIGLNLNWKTDPLTEAIAENMRKTTDSYFYLRQDDRDYMVYVVPIGNEWRCISVIDATEDFNSLGIPLFITILTAIIMSGLISFLMIRSQRTSRQAREAYMESERATAASEAKTAFLSNMSHEIRTPINAILGMNEMILREEKDETILSYSENIKNASSTLLGIINDVLDFSKIEAGKIEIIPVEYDPSSVINDVVNLIRPRAEDKGLLLELDINNDIPNRLFGDEIRIKQIITNILTNAVKYTEKGSVSLTIGYDMIPGEDAVMINVVVKDTGIGIKEEDIDRLFSKFERIEEKRNRNIEGTGLGMNITQSLLDMMGSKLNVESVYGKGSTFSFSLRQKVRNWAPMGDFEKSYREHLREMRGYSEKFTAPRAHVLVVDDNKMNLLVFESLIKKTLIKTDRASDGDEAIARTRKTKYDLIFLDHLMPGKDGIETLRIIKNEKDNPNVKTPTVCLTANAVTGAKEQYISVGFDDYLTKPIDAAKLEDVLIEYLPREKVEAPQRSRPGENKTAGGMLDKIKEAAYDMDCNRLDEAFAKLSEGYGIDKGSEFFAKLKAAVDGYEYDTIVDLIS